MSIPCKMRPAGLESLPMGYIRLDFLESTGTQYIKLGLKVQGLNVKVAYYSLFGSGPISTGSVLRVANTYTKEAYSINSYKGGSGDWANLVSVETGGAVYSAKQYVYSNPNFTAEINLSEGYLQAGTKKTVIPQDLQFAQPDMTPLLFAEATIMGAGTNYFVQKYAIIKLYSFEANYAGVPASKLIPCLDSTGKPCMFDLVTRKSFYNTATTGSDFIAGFTMAQALNLANLPAPTTTNTLIISLPKEATLVQYNQEVDAAIAAAEAKGWSMPVQYRDKFDDESILNKYAECVTISDIVAVNPDYKNDLTEEGAWIYPLTKLKTSTAVWLFNGSPMRSIDLEFSSLTSGVGIFRGCSELENVRLSFPSLTTGDFRALLEECRALKSVFVSVPNLIKCISVFANTAIEELTGDNLYAPVATDFSFILHGNTKIKRTTFDFSNAENLDYSFSGGSLVEFTSELSKLSTANNGLRGKLNKESALRILNSIPSYTSGLHRLTIGIHIDHKYDPEVNEALKRADLNYEPLNLPIDEATGDYVEITEGKGWTLTVQWSGTATENAYPNPAAAYSLRPQASPVYAKLGTLERIDGTTENFLDWGHYVTNWEENGYQEFTSLEEAYKHFNLEMPAEE